MPTKFYDKKLNFVKNHTHFHCFIAVLIKEFANQKSKKINADFFVLKSMERCIFVAAAPPFTSIFFVIVADVPLKIGSKKVFLFLSGLNYAGLVNLGSFYMQNAMV